MSALWEMVLIESGKERVVGAQPESEARAWLNAKMRSHMNNGWTVERTDTMLTARKRRLPHHQERNHLMLIRRAPHQTVAWR